jgi:DNA-binding CsgD family transcriptional regulator
MAERLIDDDFLQALYEGALHGGDWRPVLHRSAEVLASAEICLTAVDRGEIVTFETTQRLLTHEARERYATHYGALDPKIRLIARGGGGFLFNDSAYFDDAFVARDPFYQEFTRWVGTRHTLDMTVGPDAERSAFLAAMRTVEQGPFQPSAERTFTAIATHIGRVQSLKARIDSAQLKAQYAEAALDNIAYGLVVLDGEGRAMLLNARARRLAGDGGAFEWRQGRLAARSPPVDREFQAVLERARSGAEIAAASIRVPRPDGGSWIVWVVRLPASSPLAAKAAPGVLVMIGDSELRGRVRQGDLTRLYALTPAEADLALALGAGRTLREAAEDKGVSYATARSQLYAILEKTGVHRQADLARLIAGLPGAILDDLGA